MHPPDASTTAENHPPHSAATHARPVSPNHGTLTPLGLDEVRLTDGFWAQRARINAEHTLDHCQRWMQRLGWIDNFDIAAHALTHAPRAIIVDRSSPTPRSTNSWRHWPGRATAAATPTSTAASPNWRPESPPPNTPTATSTPATAVPAGPSATPTSPGDTSCTATDT